MFRGSQAAITTISQVFGMAVTEQLVLRLCLVQLYGEILKGDMREESQVQYSEEVPTLDTPGPPDFIDLGTCNGVENHSRVSTSG